MVGHICEAVMAFVSGFSPWVPECSRSSVGSLTHKKIVLWLVELQLCRRLPACSSNHTWGCRSVSPDGEFARAMRAGGKP